MNRTIEYLITEKEDGLRIEQFLRRKGYSGQNLAEIKRMPKSILVNGVHYYMRQTLNCRRHSKKSLSVKQNALRKSPRWRFHWILSTKMKTSS